MTEMIAWLRAQLDTDERIARKAANFPYDHPTDAPWERARIVVERGAAFTSDAHIAAHNPARVLRQLQAHRTILDLHARAHECSTFDEVDVDNCTWVLETESCSTVRALASIYSDGDGYREEWRP